MIELRGVAKSYHLCGREIVALAPLDLSIGDGEFVSIVGHSGSGKSTLLSLIGGISRPDAGSVRVDGTDIGGHGDAALSRLRNQRFGFIYQFASLIPTLTALENVQLPTVFGKNHAEKGARRLLEQVGLGADAERYPSELSGGEQQRVAIARAFVNQPGIVLADEPTGDLDEETEAQVMHFFEEINRERGVTILMVTHSGELAVRAGRRLRMKHGVLEELSA
ncbi:MAG TPA: ABC transporter ATP-binding protein [Myxococcales bacterium]|nr:ABC transporter ATP-binding protein [Myxococcales bacterium]